MENILLEEALKYAARGWSVFPCREIISQPFLHEGEMIQRKAKSPYIMGGFQVASTDTDTIKQWWTKYPNAAIGISCEASNLICVDIDTKDGRKGFENFMRLNISDVGALHGITPSGGNHIIYSGIANSYANVITGIDLRSGGAYFIAPPSQIYNDDGSYFGKYIKLDDWDKIPVLVPSDLIQKLDVLRNTGKKKKSSGSSGNEEINVAELLPRLKEALYKLPAIYYDEYFHWVNVGLALSTLGEDGFELWDTWSRQSSKYQAHECKYKWSKFDSRDLTVGSIFYWAKLESEKNKDD